MGFIKQTNKTRWELTNEGYQLWGEARKLRALAALELDVSSEVLLKMWSRMRTQLKGHSPIGGFLARFLGVKSSGIEEVISNDA